MIQIPLPINLVREIRLDAFAGLSGEYPVQLPRRFRRKTADYEAAKKECQRLVQAAFISIYPIWRADITCDIGQSIRSFRDCDVFPGSLKVMVLRYN
jgi:hypothetical protein